MISIERESTHSVEKLDIHSHKKYFVKSTLVTSSVLFKHVPFTKFLSENHDSKFQQFLHCLPLYLIGPLN